MAILALKQEALLGAVGLTGVAAFGACLARVVSVHLDRHRVGQQGLVGQEAVQFGKRPLGGVPVGFALLGARFLAVCAFGPLADMGQVFQADETVRMPVHDAPTEDMVAILFQPSLPRGDHDLCRARVPERSFEQPRDFERQALRTFDCIRVGGLQPRSR